MAVQVLVLMPVDTTVTFQYRHGMTTNAAVAKLYNNGGYRRFYAGILPALAQGPLSRFGDTASNAAVIAFLGETEETRHLPVVAQTLLGSLAAASWRIVIMPLDVCKTVGQVRGQARGMPELAARVRNDGPAALWRGSSAAFVATFAGHLPWYSTFNWLNRILPQPPGAIPAADSHEVAGKSPATSSQTLQRAVRHGIIGFCASVVSDCCTNSFRVVKAIRQAEGVTYRGAASLVVSKDGLSGLFFRGLQTRIIANGCQVRPRFDEIRSNCSALSRSTSQFHIHKNS